MSADISSTSSQSESGSVVSCRSSLEKLKVLIVGCGSMGNETIKLLLKEGVKHLELVDHDKVEEDNLKNQLLFGRSDIDKKKTDVIKKKIEMDYPDVRVVSRSKKIEEFEIHFFESFDFILGCVDNIRARMYLNNMIFTLRRDVIYIDGGVEECFGSVKIIDRLLPFGCIKCTLDMYRWDHYFEHYCRCGGSPYRKSLESCIHFVSGQSFIQTFGREVDVECEADIRWVMFECIRVMSGENPPPEEEHLLNPKFVRKIIQGYVPTQFSVIKVVASLLVRELKNKVQIKEDPNMKSFEVYSDIYCSDKEGLYIHRYLREPSPTCGLCNRRRVKVTFSRTETLAALLDAAKREQHFTQCFISTTKAILYSRCSFFPSNTERKLAYTFAQLIELGEIVEEDYVFVESREWTHSLCIHITIV